MKVAIYIEDGLTQIALTAENDFEKSALDLLTAKDQNIEVLKGGFYHCAGGWVRQNRESMEESVMIRITKTLPDKNPLLNANDQ